jgi:hypothetical protein
MAMKLRRACVAATATRADTKPPGAAASQPRATVAMMDKSPHPPVGAKQLLWHGAHQRMAINFKASYQIPGVAGIDDAMLFATKVSTVIPVARPCEINADASSVRWTQSSTTGWPDSVNRTVTVNHGPEMPSSTQGETTASMRQRW